MSKIWNYPLIWKIVKIVMALLVFLFVFNSCDEDSVLPNQPEMTLMSSEAPTIPPQTPSSA